MKAKVEKLQHITKDLDAINPTVIAATIRVNYTERTVDTLSIDRVGVVIADKIEIDITSDVKKDKVALDKIIQQVESDCFDKADEIFTYEPEEADVYANHY